MLVGLLSRWTERKAKVSRLNAVIDLKNARIEEMKAAVIEAEVVVTNLQAQYDTIRELVSAFVSRDTVPDTGSRDLIMRRLQDLTGQVDELRTTRVIRFKQEGDASENRNEENTHQTGQAGNQDGPPTEDSEEGNGSADLAGAYLVRAT